MALLYVINLIYRRSGAEAMTKKQKAQQCVELLLKEYPDASCTLNDTDPYQLLVAVRLAAQCTDARVNMVTPALFERFPTVFDMAQADPIEIEGYIKSCGFYHAKARDISLCAKMLVEKYNGRVPDTMEQLLELPGVGRKSANLILGDVYGKEAIVTDTHCIRITNLLGLVDSKEPVKVEMQLRKIVPLDKGSDFCHALVLHGRKVCVARRPDCGRCCLRELCDYCKKNGK